MGSEDVLPSRLSAGNSPHHGKRKRMIEICSNLLDKRQQAQPAGEQSDVVQISASSMTKDVIENLFAKANISMVDYEYLIPTKDQRANHPPTDYITVYKEQVNKGLRFPFQGLVTKVCSLICISPSQLVPEAYCLIKGFISNAKTYHIPTTVLDLFSVFNVSPAPMLGFFDFVPRAGNKSLNIKRPSLGHWETEFFFLRHRDIHESWGCLSEWKGTCKEPPFSSGLIKAEDESNLFNDILVHMSHQLGVSQIPGNLMLNGGIKLELPSHQTSFSETHLTAPTPPPVASTKNTTSPLKVPLGSLRSSATHNANPSRDEEIATRASLSTMNVTSQLKFTSGSPRTPATHKSHPSRTSTNEAQHTSTTAFLAISKIVESAYVPRQTFENLEKDNVKLVLELALEKSRVEELKKELKDSKAERFSHEIKRKKDNVKLVSELALEKSRVEEPKKELKDSKAERFSYEIKRMGFLERVRAMERRTVENIQAAADRHCDEIRAEVAEITESLG